MSANQIRVGRVLRRRSDGKKFRIVSMRKQGTNTMHSNREFDCLDDPEAPSQADEIRKLERMVEKLELDLAATIRKVVTSSAPDDDDDVDEPNAFDQATNEIMKRDSVSRLVAMARARHEAPDAFADFQKSAGRPASFTPPDTRAKHSSLQFQQEVARIASERKISKTQAMSLCRKENPSLFLSMQRGDDD